MEMSVRVQEEAPNVITNGAVGGSDTDAKQEQELELEQDDSSGTSPLNPQGSPGSEFQLSEVPSEPEITNVWPAGGAAQAMPVVEGTEQSITGRWLLQGSERKLNEGTVKKSSVFSPNARWLATAVGNEQSTFLNVWTLDRKNGVFQPPALCCTVEGAGGGVLMAFHPNNRWLVTCNQQHGIHLWDIGTPRATLLFSLVAEHKGVTVPIGSSGVASDSKSPFTSLCFAPFDPSGNIPPILLAYDADHILHLFAVGGGGGAPSIMLLQSLYLQERVSDTENHRLQSSVPPVFCRQGQTVSHLVLADTAGNLICCPWSGIASDALACLKDPSLSATKVSIKSIMSQRLSACSNPCGPNPSYFVDSNSNGYVAGLLNFSSVFFVYVLRGSALSLHFEFDFVPFELNPAGAAQHFLPQCLTFTPDGGHLVMGTGSRCLMVSLASKQVIWDRNPTVNPIVFVNNGQQMIEMAGPLPVVDVRTGIDLYSLNPVVHIKALVTDTKLSGEATLSFCLQAELICFQYGDLGHAMVMELRRPSLSQVARVCPVDRSNILSSPSGRYLVVAHPTGFQLLNAISLKLVAERKAAEWSIDLDSVITEALFSEDERVLVLYGQFGTGVAVVAVPSLITLYAAKLNHPADVGQGMGVYLQPRAVLSRDGTTLALLTQRARLWIISLNKSSLGSIATCVSTVCNGVTFSTSSIQMNAEGSLVWRVSQRAPIPQPDPVKDTLLECFSSELPGNAVNIKDGLESAPAPTLLYSSVVTKSIRNILSAPQNVSPLSPPSLHVQAGAGSLATIIVAYPLAPTSTKLAVSVFSVDMHAAASRGESKSESPLTDSGSGGVTQRSSYSLDLQDYKISVSSGGFSPKGSYAWYILEEQTDNMGRIVNYQSLLVMNLRSGEKILHESRKYRPQDSPTFSIRCWSPDEHFFCTQYEMWAIQPHLNSARRIAFFLPQVRSEFRVFSSRVAFNPYYLIFNSSANSSKSMLLPLTMMPFARLSSEDMFDLARYLLDSSNRFRADKPMLRLFTQLFLDGGCLQIDSNGSSLLHLVVEEKNQGLWELCFPDEGDFSHVRFVCDKHGRTPLTIALQSDYQVAELVEFALAHFSTRELECVATELPRLISFQKVVNGEAVHPYRPLVIKLIQKLDDQLVVNLDPSWDQTTVNAAPALAAYYADASMNPLSSLASAGMSEAVESRTVQLVVNHKWNTFVKRRYFVQLLLYAAYMAVFCVITLSSLPAMGSGWNNSAASVIHWLLEAILLAASIAYLLAPIRVIRIFGFVSYFSNFFAWCDVSAYSLVILSVILRAAAADITSIRPVEALAATILWIKALNFARAFEETSRFVRVLLVIYGHIVYFLVVLFIVILAFSHGFFSLYREGEAEDSSLYGSWNAIYDVWFALIGLNPGVAYLSQATNPGMATFLMICFTVIANLVLLSLLITLLGKAYEVVTANVKRESALERLRVILELEAGAPYVPSHFPRLIRAPAVILNVKQAAAQKQQEELEKAMPEALRTQMRQLIKDELEQENRKLMMEIKYLMAKYLPPSTSVSATASRT